MRIGCFYHCNPIFCSSSSSQLKYFNLQNRCLPSSLGKTNTLNSFIKEIQLTSVTSRHVICYFSSISMCGLPVSPVPLSNFWTQSLEERAEVNNWERTKWTWGTTRLLELRGLHQPSPPVTQVCCFVNEVWSWSYMLDIAQCFT